MVIFDEEYYQELPVSRDSRRSISSRAEPFSLDDILLFVIAGDLQHLKDMRLPHQQYFDNLAQHALLVAASKGHLYIADWLIKTCKVPTDTVDSRGYDYIDCFGDAVVDLVRNQQFDNKIDEILQKHPSLIKTGTRQNENIESAVLEKVLSYVRADDLVSLQQLQKKLPISFANVINKNNHSTDNPVITYAASRGHINIVKWLIFTCKVNVNIKDKRGFNYFTCFNDAIIKFIDSDMLPTIKNFYAEYPELLTLETPLNVEIGSAIHKKMIAYAGCGDLSRLKELQRIFPVWFAHNINKTHDVMKRNPLIAAASGGCVEVVEWLIQTCKADTSAKDSRGFDYLTCFNDAIIDCVIRKNFLAIESIYEKYPLLMTPQYMTDMRLYSVIWDKIVESTACGDLTTLKRLKNIFPFIFSCVVNKQHEKTGDTALLWAASHGHIDIVNWLLTEGEASSELKDRYGHDYTYHLDIAAINLARNKEFEKIARISEHKGVTLNVVRHGESAKQFLFTAMIDAAKAGDKKTLTLFEKSKIQDLIGIHDPLLLRDANLFAQAIKNGGLKRINSLMSYTLLTRQIACEKGIMLTAVELADKYGKTKIAMHLLKSGADAGGLADKYLLNTVQITANEALLTIDQRIKEIRADLHGRHARDMKEKHEDFLAFSNEYLSMIEAENNSAKQCRDMYKKIDWLMVVNSVLLAIKNSKSITELESTFKNLLVERESAIANTRLDYCFDMQSPANKLCEAIAMKLSPKAPCNQLLFKACTEGREQPWFDPLELDENKKQILPHQSQFFRTSKNEIHIYEYIVDAAISRMTHEDASLLEHIWFGTDPKCVKPVPPLHKNQLSILKQRSPALQELIEYTEQLDAHVRFPDSLTVLEHFTQLKNGLYAGDYRVTGSHYKAGEAAYAAIATFSDWWNELKRINPAVCKHISRLGAQHGETHDTLGEAIAILFDQNNLRNSARTDDAQYCIHIKANMIERILAMPAVRSELASIQLGGLGKDSFERLSKAELETLRDRIFKELKDNSLGRNIVTQDSLYQLDVNPHYLVLNLLLIKQGVIDRYSDFLDVKLRENTLTKLIQYVLTESDNASLLQLRDILNRAEFSSLHEVDPASLGFFKTTYYAHINGQRTQTNKLYAYLEEMIAAQLVKNTVQEPVSDPKQTIAKVSALYQQHGFMSIHRKRDYHMKDENTKYMHIVSSGRTVQEIQRKVAEKIEQLKVSYR